MHCNGLRPFFFCYFKIQNHTHSSLANVVACYGVRFLGRQIIPFAILLRSTLCCQFILHICKHAGCTSSSFVWPESIRRSNCTTINTRLNRAKLNRNLCESASNTTHFQHTYIMSMKMIGTHAKTMQNAVCCRNVFGITTAFTFHIFFHVAFLLHCKTSRAVIALMFHLNWMNYRHQIEATKIATAPSI